MRKEFFIISIVSFLVLALLSFLWRGSLAILIVVWAPLFLLGLYDIAQRKRTILRNFPVIGHLRYFFESIRPEIQQYFVESNLTGTPINREMRSVIYQRAKGDPQTLPFGTQRQVYAEGYEWVNHSLKVKHVDPNSLRVMIGNKQCKQIYNSNLINISAMSYGSLSSAAIQALNEGAAIGDFYHNTGEGGVSPHHLHGGDLVWQIGTGYFGCRTADGHFDEKTFKDTANKDEIKMIELKLSQGAKPGHGGLLPASKVTPEIAKIRHIPLGKDVNSPPMHSAFDDAEGLVKFLQKLRDLCGGKPIGFKLCIGNKDEFIEICQAMIKLEIYPDFITVDGGEGGTGAAPLEFSNSIGLPLKDGLVFVHDTLKKFNLREHIKVIAAGKAVTGFDVIRMMALGADVVNMARAMMMSLGCIQALRCHTNSCPTGIATNKPELVEGLDINLKKQRVARYHRETIESVAEILGAMGLNSTKDVQRKHIQRRVSHFETKSYADIYPV